MIKRFLKRLLEYCPHPSKPLTTTLKPYTLPIVMLVTASIAMVSYYYLVLPGTTTQTISPQILPSLSLSEVQAGESNYYPGVIAGDYVIYGDYHCNVSHPTGPEWEWLICLGEREWMKVEVVGVSGKGVTLRYTDKLKNGSATSHNGCVHLIWDIDHPTWHNGTCGFYQEFLGHIVAANLTEGDSIHSTGPCSMPPHTVNQTEIRTYLGVDRWVNIMKIVVEPAERIWVFDAESGIMLEYEEISPINRRSGYRIVETNIFHSTSPSSRSSLIQENIETGITPALPDYLVDDWIETDFKIWIGNEELNSPKEEDVILQTYDGKDYLVVKRPMSEEFWLPPPTDENAEFEGGMYLDLYNSSLHSRFFPDEEQEYCGTFDINDQELIDKLIEIGIYPIKEKDVSAIFIGHQTGNLWMTENGTGPLADFWLFMLQWDIGTFEIPNPEWTPDPIIVPHHLMLEGETDRGIEPEGEYDENTDTWTVTFDTMFELLENTLEPNPEFDDDRIKLWEGSLRFTLKIQRLLPQ